MPRGQPGTLTHGASAYQRGACRCKEICTPEHTRIRRLQRAALQQHPSGGRFVQLDEGVVALVTTTERRCLDSLLKDGADSQTIARRLQLSERTVRRHLTDVQQGLGFNTRIEMVTALFRGRAGYREVASTTRDETSHKPARRRKGA